jgi:ADP-heptose:LPS heptosyltransferase
VPGFVRLRFFPRRHHLLLYYDCFGQERGKIAPTPLKSRVPLARSRLFFPGSQASGRSSASGSGPHKALTTPWERSLSDSSSVIFQFLKTTFQDILFFLYKILGFFIKRKKSHYNILGNESIVFISCFFIGDCLFLTPIYREIKKQHPKIKITVLVNDYHVHSLLRSNPYIDNLVFVKNYFQAILFVIKNWRTKYDIIMDYATLFWWSFVFRFLRAGFRVARQNRHRVGHFLLNDFTWLHDRVIPYRGQYIVDYYAQIMEEMGVAIPHREMEISLEPQEIPQALLSFDLAEEAFIILHPGARNRENLWHRWPELIYLLKRDFPHYTLVLTGTAKDAHWLGKMMSSPVFSLPRVRCLLGKTTLRQLAALICRCEVFIGGDTGASHMAIALGKPTVMLFGRADCHLYAPSQDNVKIIHGTTDCYPCYTYEKIYYHCPYEKSACMESIQPVAVIQALDLLLRGCNQQAIPFPERTPSVTHG